MSKTAASPAGPAASAVPAGDLLEERRAAALGRLTPQFAHELRNSLTGIKCYLELVSEVELPPSIAGFFGEMEQGFERVTALSSRWLELVHGRSATSSPATELHRLVLLLRSSGFGKRVQFVEEFDERAGCAVDGYRLQSLLFVLVAEVVGLAPQVVRLACTAGSEGVHVRIAAAGTARAVARVDEARALAAALAGELAVLEGLETGFELTLPAA